MYNLKHSTYFPNTSFNKGGIHLNNEKLFVINTNNYSEDILPTPYDKRTWNSTNFFTVWMGSVHNIPNYLAVGGLFALGLSVKQVFFAIICASIILSIVLVLNGHAGSKYGLPFSMLLRTSYGVKGAAIIGSIRGVLVAIMWFGFQTFAGSQALLILIGHIYPPFLSLGNDWNFLGLSFSAMISFILFWLLNIVFVFGGMKILGKFTNYLFWLIYLVFGGMAVWAINLAGGIGPIINHTGTEISNNQAVVFLGAVTAIIASWAAPMVSVSDFTRLARSHKDQIIGQASGVIITYLLFAIASISIIVGSEIAFGTPIWNILDVIDRINSKYAIGLSILTLCLTTLSVNVTGNIVPAGYQIAALFPKYLNFKTAAFIASIFGIIIMPWKIMENSTSIFTFLNIIGGTLGPVTGVMLTHYFIISKTKIDLNELYFNSNRYRYNNGYNLNALIATFVSSVICLSGQFLPLFYPLYQMSWIVGTLTAIILYFLLEIPNLGFIKYEKTG